MAKSKTKKARTCQIRGADGQICGARVSDQHHKECHQAKGSLTYSDGLRTLTRNDDGFFHCSCGVKKRSVQDLRCCSEWAASHPWSLPPLLKDQGLPSFSLEPRYAVRKRRAESTSVGGGLAKPSGSRNVKPRRGSRGGTLALDVLHDNTRRKEQGSGGGIHKQAKRLQPAVYAPVAEDGEEVAGAAGAEEWKGRKGEEDKDSDEQDEDEDDNRGDGRGEDEHAGNEGSEGEDEGDEGGEEGADDGGSEDDDADDGGSEDEDAGDQEYVQQEENRGGGGVGASVLQVGRAEGQGRRLGQKGRGDGRCAGLSDSESEVENDSAQDGARLLLSTAEDSLDKTRLLLGIMENAGIQVIGGDGWSWPSCVACQSIWDPAYIVRHVRNKHKAKAPRGLWGRVEHWVESCEWIQPSRKDPEPRLALAGLQRRVGSYCQVCAMVFEATPLEGHECGPLTPCMVQGGQFDVEFNYYWRVIEEESKDRPPFEVELEKFGLLMQAHADTTAHHAGVVQESGGRSHSAFVTGAQWPKLLNGFTTADIASLHTLPNPTNLKNASTWEGLVVCGVRVYAERARELHDAGGWAVSLPDVSDDGGVNGGALRFPGAISNGVSGILCGADFGGANFMVTDTKFRTYINYIASIVLHLLRLYRGERGPDVWQLDPRGTHNTRAELVVGAATQLVREGATVESDSERFFVIAAHIGQLLGDLILEPVVGDFNEVTMVRAFAPMVMQPTGGFIAEHRMSERFAGLAFCIKLVFFERSVAAHFRGHLAKWVDEHFRPSYEAYMPAMRTTVGGLCGMRLQSARNIGFGAGGSALVAWGRDGTYLMWKGTAKISMDTYRDMYTKAVDELERYMAREVFSLSSDVLPQRDLLCLRDDLSENVPGGWWGGDKANSCKLGLGLLAEAVVGVPGWLGSDGGIPARVVNKLIGPGGLEQTILQKAMVPMYLGGGERPRGTEFFSVVLWPSGAVNRGMWLVDGQFVTNPSQSKNRNGRGKRMDQLCLRWLDPRLSNILSYYLYDVIRVTNMAWRQQQRSKGAAEVGRSEYLFVNHEGKRFDTKTLSDTLKKASMMEYGVSNGCRDHRQIGVAIRNKFFPQAYFEAGFDITGKDLDELGDDEDEGEGVRGPAAAFALVANHSVSMDQSHYGLLVQSGNLSTELLDKMRPLSEVSHLWFSQRDSRDLVPAVRTSLLGDRPIKGSGGITPQVTQIVPEAGAVRPPAALSVVSNTSARAPIQEEIKLAMAKRYGLDFHFKPLQARALTNMMHPGTCQVVVMKTGGGKSALFEIPLMMGHGVAIIVGYVALAHSTLDTLTKANLPAQLYEGTQTHYQRAIIFSADALAVGTRAWQDLAGLVERGRIHHIIYDEVHCMITQGRDFRPNLLEMQHLKTITGSCLRVRPSFTGLSATIPVSSESLMAKLLMEENMLWVRGPTSRANIAYAVVSKPPGDDTDPWVKGHLGALLKGLRKGEKMIVYLKSISEADRIAAALGCDAYHSKLAAGHYRGGGDQLSASEMRQTIQEAWVNGDSQCVVATSGFGEGINCLKCTLVVHVEIPWSATNFAQESGRAGRAGQASRSIILNTKQIRSVAYNQLDSQQDPVLCTMVNTDRCRRLPLTGHFDTHAVECCEIPNAERCDNCVVAGQRIKLLVDVTHPARPNQAESPASAIETTGGRSGQGKKTQAVLDGRATYRLKTPIRSNPAPLSKQVPTGGVIPTASSSASNSYEGGRQTTPDDMECPRSVLELAPRCSNSSLGSFPGTGSSDDRGYSVINGISTTPVSEPPESGGYYVPTSTADSWDSGPDGSVSCNATPRQPVAGLPEGNGNAALGGHSLDKSRTKKPPPPNRRSGGSAQCLPPAQQQRVDQTYYQENIKAALAYLSTDDAWCMYCLVKRWTQHNPKRQDIQHSYDDCPDSDQWLVEWRAFNSGKNKLDPGSTCWGCWLPQIVCNGAVVKSPCAYRQRVVKRLACYLKSEWEPTCQSGLAKECLAAGGGRPKWGSRTLSYDEYGRKGSVLFGWKCCGYFEVAARFLARWNWTGKGEGLEVPGDD